MLVRPCAGQVVALIAPTFKSKAMVLVGRPGWGKTPLMQAIAMAMSKFWIDNPSMETREDRPSFRTTEALDFLRREPGCVERPDIFDDGDMNSQSLSSLRAFLDMSRQEGMLWARWGAAKFMKHQFETKRNLWS